MLKVGHFVAPMNVAPYANAPRVEENKSWKYVD
jgi:hypothetical protein